MLGGHLEDAREPLPRGGLGEPLTTALGGLHLPGSRAHQPGGGLHSVRRSLHVNCRRLFVANGLHSGRTGLPSKG